MSNVDVKVTADVVDFQTKLAVAKAEAQAFSKELVGVAREAVAAGGTMSSEMKAGAQAAAEGMLRAKNEAAALQRQIKETSDTTPSFAAGLSSIRGMLATLGLSLSVGALVSFGENVEKNTASLQHEADVLQLSVTAYQAFRNAAIDSGVDTDIADGAIRKFSKSVGEASVGTGKAALDFFEMGISLNQSKEAILQQVAAFMLHADWQERDRLATELFSRTGAEILPLLPKWAEGVDNLTQKYGAQGRMLDPGITDAAEQADIRLAQSWQEMHDAAAGPVALLTNALASLIEKFAELPTKGGVVGGVVVITPTQPTTPPAAPSGERTPVPKAKPDETADDLAVLSSINPKIKERADLEKELAAAITIRDSAEAAADAHLKQTAIETIADKQKQLDALNKPGAFGGGFSNAGDKLITETKAANAEIAADQTKTAQEIYAAEQANWQRLLDGHKLNAKQILDVKKTMAQEELAFERQARQQADAEARSDAARDITLAKDALEQKRIVLDEELKNHQITAQQAYDQTKTALDAEVAAEMAAQQQIIDSVNTTVTQKHDAWNREQEIWQQHLNDMLAAHRKLVADLKAEDALRAQSWSDVDSEIENAESGLVSDILTKNQSLTTDLLQLGAKLVEQEIQDDLKLLTQHILVDNGMMAADQATASGGLLAKLFGWESAAAAHRAAAAAELATTTSTTAAQTAAVTAGTTATTAATAASQATQTATVAAGTAAQTAARTAGTTVATGLIATETVAQTVGVAGQVAAVTVGEAAKVASKAAGAATGLAIQKTVDAATISGDAAKAAAGAYSAVVGIPIIGPILAPIAAGVAFAAVEAFGSFDKGVNVMPHDAIVKVHSGERIVPAADNRALINALAGRGEDRIGGAPRAMLNYSPVINYHEPKGLGDLLQEDSRTMIDFIHGAIRDGSLDLGDQY